MCRGIERMRKAFANLEDEIRNINTTKRFAIVEKNDYGFDLLGFLAVYNDCEGQYFETKRDGSIEKARFVRAYNGMSYERIARDFDAPHALVRSF